MVNGPLLPILEVFELVALVGLAACTVWLALRSFPAALQSRQKRVENIVEGLRTELAQIVDQRTAWKAQGERLAEEVSTYLDQIERKRASTAASASRLKRSQTENAEPIQPNQMSRGEQLEYARRSIL